MDDYMNALIKEIKSFREPLREYSVQTIFMGGGTPTLFDAGCLSEVLDVCRSSFHVLEDAEVTLEANPGTLDRGKIKTLFDAGVNRLSMGLQVWQEKHLVSLGRIHKSQDLINDIDWAREAGFDNFNVDVMFGLPFQTFDEWMETLYNVLKLGIDHISAYSLKIEQNTPFSKLLDQGHIVLPSEDEERRMYHEGIKALATQGFMQYETSNFAQPGRQCWHNLIYWKNQYYLGCGSGAHSYLNRRRFANRPDVEGYIRDMMENKNPVSYSELIGESEERFETIMLGLRLVEGISKSSFIERFGNSVHFYYKKAVGKLKERGLITEDDEFIRLTPKGMDLQNQVLLEFMD